MPLAKLQINGLSIYNIKDKAVCIVDQHNYVLPVWAAAAKQQQQRFRLVTFDYHRDTQPCFNKYAYDQAKAEQDYTGHHLYKRILEIQHKRLKQVEAGKISSVIAAVQDLMSDEHIVAAYSMGIISEYHVFNHLENGQNLPGGYFYKTDLPADAYQGGYLEDRFINSTKFQIPWTPFILDFDLDYFPRRSSFCPRSRTIINTLIRNASLITVAREKNYFDIHKTEEFSVEEAEQLLLILIRDSLTSQAIF